MADIFLSYAREDHERARPLVEALIRLGWTVWWDRIIPPGKTWCEVIGVALAEARCVVVLWSSRSMKSRWVTEEAEQGLKRNVLIPALIEDGEPPLGFGSIQTADLSNWGGDESSPGFQDLLAGLKAILGVPPLPEQEKALEVSSQPEAGAAVFQHESQLVRVGPILVRAYIGNKSHDPDTGNDRYDLLHLRFQPDEVLDCTTELVALTVFRSDQAEFVPDAPRFEPVKILGLSCPMFPGKETTAILVNCTEKTRFTVADQVKRREKDRWQATLRINSGGNELGVFAVRFEWSPENGLSSPQVSPSAVELPDLLPPKEELLHVEAHRTGPSLGVSLDNRGGDPVREVSVWVKEIKFLSEKVRRFVPDRPAFVPFRLRGWVGDIYDPTPQILGLVTPDGDSFRIQGNRLDRSVHEEARTVTGTWKVKLMITSGPRTISRCDVTWKWDGEALTQPAVAEPEYETTGQLAWMRLPEGDPEPFKDDAKLIEKLEADGWQRTKPPKEQGKVDEYESYPMTFVREALEDFSDLEKEFLRFLLHSGDTPPDRFAASNLPQDVIGSALTKARRRNLISDQQNRVGVVVSSRIRAGYAEALSMLFD